MISNMRSPRVFVGAGILLLGVPIALLSSILFDAGASAILHIALGASFLLIASAVFDFQLPPWMNWVGGAGIAAAGVVFLLQGISDIVQSQPFATFAYGVLGQYLEKVLGYVFILWCVALVFFDSRGRTQPRGLCRAGGRARRRGLQLRRPVLWRRSAGHPEVTVPAGLRLAHAGELETT